MPRCVSGCVMSSASPSRTRTDEAVAGPRVADDGWVLGVPQREELRHDVHI